MAAHRPISKPSFATHLVESVRLRITLIELLGERHSPEHFVMEHGQPFPVVAPTRSFPRGSRRRNLCFTNSMRLAHAEDLIYVEGFATHPHPGEVMHHGWCVDADGRVLDPTWRVPGLAYFGVPFRRSYSELRYVEQGGFLGSLLTVGDEGNALVRGTERRKWRV